MMNLRLIFFAILLMAVSFVSAQDSHPRDWFNLSPLDDGIPGVSVDKTYNELLKGKKAQLVVVAVLDSGVDAWHEDLKDVMWVNENEIAGNGIDDDHNGYVDDIHGWNFIGGKDGRNVHHDNFEMTRLYAIYKAKYENRDVSKLSKKEKKEYEKYQEFDKVIKQKQEELPQNVNLYKTTMDAILALEKAIGKEDISLDDLQQFETENPMLSNVANFMATLVEQGESFSSVKGQVIEAYEYFHGQLAYHYNPDFDPRGIVGDNYDDPKEKGYGNNDVQGPDAMHGTFVAGIIAAVRGNGIGMSGVANNVRIMSVRTVPDGDERDKDVANAIIYAVDNGASIINMSFGKGESPYKGVVDKAIKYAQKNDVLIVHAAGNDKKENTFHNNFPNDKYQKKGLFGPKFAENWLEVGASTFSPGEGIVASFSNYSADIVDVFAPGVEIYSTVPGNAYDVHQGTSFAAPVVAGIAAVLRSYFPELTAKQLKDIIMLSADRQKGKVIMPGLEKKVPFSQLSVSGGIVNGYKAVELANRTKGKKKHKSKSFIDQGSKAKDKSKKKDVVLP